MTSAEKKAAKLTKEYAASERKAARRLAEIRKISDQPVETVIQQNALTPLQHQRVLCRYMRYGGLKRILLLHGTGTGKSFSVVYAIYCLLQEIAKSPEMLRHVRRIVFLTVAGNTGAFAKAIKQMGPRFDDLLDSINVARNQAGENNLPVGIEFLTHTQMTLQWQRAHDSDVDTDLRDWKNDWRGTILVVDEAHAFTQSIFKIVPSSKMRSLFDAAKQAEFVFLLTATPCKNRVSDFYTLHKVLIGDSTLDQKHVKKDDAGDMKWTLSKNVNSLLLEYRSAFAHEKLSLSDWKKVQKYADTKRADMTREMREQQEKEDAAAMGLSEKEGKRISKMRDKFADIVPGDARDQGFPWVSTGMMTGKSPYNLFCQVSYVPGAKVESVGKPKVFEDDGLLKIDEKNPEFVQQFRQRWYSKAGEKGFKTTQRLAALAAAYDEEPEDVPFDDLIYAEDSGSGKRAKPVWYLPSEKTLTCARLALKLAACGKKVMVYADFVKSGVKMFRRLLEREARSMTRGQMDKLNAHVDAYLKSAEDDVKRGLAPLLSSKCPDAFDNIPHVKAADLTGEATSEEREATVKWFNDEVMIRVNNDGKETYALKARPETRKIIVVSGAGAIGIELLNVNAVIMLSPPWSTGKDEQARGRVDRNRSHEALPPKDRYVVYFNASSTVLAKNGEKLSIERNIYKLLRRKREDIAAFLEDVNDTIAIEGSVKREQREIEKPGFISIGGKLKKAHGRRLHLANITTYECSPRNRASGEIRKRAGTEWEPATVQQDEEEILDDEGYDVEMLREEAGDFMAPETEEDVEAEKKRKKGKSVVMQYQRKAEKLRKKEEKREIAEFEEADLRREALRKRDGGPLARGPAKRRRMMPLRPSEAIAMINRERRARA
jgi:hypothetical protein